MTNAEKKSLFGRIFGGAANDAEEARDTVPQGSEFEPAHRETPRHVDADDVEVTVTEDAPSPDLHRPAAAPTEADEEAGADAARRADEGGITPLKKDGKETKRDFDRPSAPAGKGGAEGAVSADPSGGSRTPWMQRLRRGLARSSQGLGSGLNGIFRSRKLDDDTLEALEDLLIQADLGVETATEITERLARERHDAAVDEREVREILAREVEKVLADVAEPLFVDVEKEPFVVLVVGVNGTGKTTTIGKLAQKYAEDDYSVMLAAGDTFRAAAIAQLKIWGERTGSPVIAGEPGADAAAIAFEAMKRAKEERAEVLFIDTAGRLQNKDELMAELEKMVRVIKKHDPTAPHAVLLTLDATTGQNALQQVEVFRERAGVTGLVMTKLDGTARGGILVAVARKYGLPVHYIGVGETVDDLQPFTARDFAQAIAGLD